MAISRKRIPSIHRGGGPLISRSHDELVVTMFATEESRVRRSRGVQIRRHRAGPRFSLGSKRSTMIPP